MWFFLPPLTILILIFFYFFIATKLALLAIAPKKEDYGCVQRKETKNGEFDTALLDLKYEKMFQNNRSGLELVGRMYSCVPGTNRYIIFNHGYNYPWIGVLKYIPMLLQLGFNVFVPDHQAEGESEGKYITFGFKESDDSIGWMDEIQKHAVLNGYERAEIGVMGESMGGVTALLMAAEAGDRLKFCIADCPFSNWDDMMKIYAKSRFNLPLGIFLHGMHLVVKVLTGVDMVEVDVVKAAEKIKIPTLIIHGELDKLVPPRMSREIIEANPKIEYFLQKDAGHVSSIVVDKKKYRETVCKFLHSFYLTDQYLSNEEREWQML